MGRWGYCLFESDADMDIIYDLDQGLGTGQPEIPFSQVICQRDMAGPPSTSTSSSGRTFDLDATVTSIRQNLDTNNLADRLFTIYRARESEYEGEYRVILLGAALMRVSAKISDDNLQHLRELVPRINRNEGYTSPLFDQGFRGPGKRQFLAALDRYRAGVPRDFSEPSCFGCGKIRDDVGKVLAKCSHCEAAYYCDKDCQKGHWKEHKKVCKTVGTGVTPGGYIMLNV